MLFLSQEFRSESGECSAIASFTVDGTVMRTR